ncbi:pentapeptide repeat-containing protein [cf. Phormidesmis sp. LEGE 11477]|uniref:pentapeptide repeat-containing protein n=1 Tax=cf. Phormidesmis sp. LEGE 11477 TaxID=1828680 RepID=UPI00187EE210|nr:pentapeptide repeat-containing protein [cf. Phormidesmis sp. LEGE 11477]MBE9063692.1 pentapeptide repeat-containing protein [cf. Phormidesmis sp. LEGE 11477]
MLRVSRRNIKGQQFSQKNLTFELCNTIAGQKISRKIKLLLGLVVIGLVLSLICGAVFATLGTGIISNNDTTADRLLYMLSAIVVAAWLVVTVWLGTSKGLLAVTAGIVLVQIMGFGLVLSNTIRDEHFLISVAATVLVYWLICNLFLGFSRLAFAIVDILFESAQIARMIWVGAIALGALLGAFLVIEATSPSFVRIISILSGIGSTVLLTVGGWCLNRRQNIPWRSPEAIRSWALILGSWGGTSFYGLDLSEMNFQGAGLQNSDFRARNLNRTCLKGVQGLSRARVDNRYLDLEDLRVQKLLTHGCSQNKNFQGLNLQGAYLQAADMRDFDFTEAKLSGADFKQADLRGSVLVRSQLAGADFRGVDLRNNNLTDANLTGADLSKADLRGSILVRAQIAQADFSQADLTGICIEDWSVSNATRFTQARCDYVYKKYIENQPAERYPADRDFEVGEFAALFQQPADLLELIFKGDLDYNALSLAFYKLEAEAPELEIEIKGIEQRGNLWVVKVNNPSALTASSIAQRLNLSNSSSHPVSSDTAANGSAEAAIETALKDSIYKEYEETKSRLEASEQLVQQLAGVTSSQAEALKGLSQQSFGNHFSITGSTITNLAGSGEISYAEAANQVRALVNPNANAVQTTDAVGVLLARLQTLKIATTPATQTELIQQLLISEAGDDPAFAELLIQQKDQILAALPEKAIAAAIQGAIAILTA